MSTIIVIGGKNIKSTNTGSGESNIPDNYIFRITEDPTELSNNLNLAANILFEKCVSVKLIGTLEGIEYNLIGTYCNGYITSPSENSILVFNVDFNNGNITLYTIYNLNQILPYIPLEIGDSDEVKSKNKKNLSIGGHFFTQIDYGFGVGTYNSSNGGFAHITTAYGNEVFYDISADGAVSNNSDYIKPNMPFSITIESDIIDTTISDDVLISNIKECGEIIVKGTNGLVEFNKTADSTTSILYFLNIRKDKTFQVLQFDTTSNQLTSTIIQ